MGVTATGSLVSAWEQYDTYTPHEPVDNTYPEYVADTNLYFREWHEDTDDVGPIVTDMTLASGDRLANNGQVNQSVQYLIVDFDEDMLQGTGPNSITNPNNWSLVDNGVAVGGAIRSIEFGMNKAEDLAGVLPLDPVGTNKWEAVIEVDGNGLLTGVTPLANGHYQLIAKASLEDAVGNPMGATGFNQRQGVAFTRSFDVLVPTNQEVRVNADTTGAQTTYDAADGNADSGSQATASDPNGDYVVVWTSTDAASPGLYAKLYQATWSVDASGTRQSSVTQVAAIDPATGQPWPNNEILVTADTTATDPAAARDADGNFVVTWSQEASDPATSWDVYARRYTAAGTPLSDAFLVDTDTTGIQRHPAVAMDPEGDFTITWQGLDPNPSLTTTRDLSDYGVYAQRSRHPGWRSAEPTKSR